MNDKKYDNSKKLLIQHHSSGIKLVRPNKGIDNTLQATVGDLLDLPVVVYFEDVNHVTKLCNEINVKECGFISMKDCLKFPWYKAFNRKSVMTSLVNDTLVVQKGVHKICEEVITFRDGPSIHTLSVRMPWYDVEGKVIGLFGCSIVLGKHSLADSLTKIVKFGLINPRYKLSELNFNKTISNLTRRESECLELILNGKSTKEIAKILDISYRTVEKHQESIKTKYGCKTIHQLVSQLLKRNGVKS